VFYLGDDGHAAKPFEDRGVTALTMGVFYLLYRKLLSLPIFSTIDSTQTFLFVSLIALLVWSTAIAALILNDPGTKAFVFGNSNVVLQGVKQQGPLPKDH